MKILLLLLIVFLKVCMKLLVDCWYDLVMKMNEVLDIFILKCVMWLIYVDWIREILYWFIEIGGLVGKSEGEWWIAIWKNVH